MKLKTILQLTEWLSLNAPAVNRNPDSKLRPTPGGMNDNSPNWDNVVEGKGWFCYMEGNDWNKRTSKATVYITEGDKPYKLWMEIKTHGLRKPNDTRKIHEDRVRKHIKKVAGSWMSEARQIYNNPELNEVGNPIPITWKEAFHEALCSPKIKAHLADCGEQAMVDPVNFTPRT